MTSDAATPDPADPAIHHVAFPMGTEGPYTVAELRAMLGAGRLRADDRVMREGTRATALVSDLVPDAAVLASQAERVRRRSTAEMQPAKGPKPATGSEARRFRTPLPATAPSEEGTAPLADPMAQPPAAPPRNRRLAGLLMVLAVLTAVLVGYLVIAAPLGGGERTQQPVGRWAVGHIGTLGGPWLLELDESSLTVTAPDGGKVRSAVVRTVEDATHTRLVLTPPHPVLGGQISLVGTAVLEITTAAGTGSGDPAL